MLTAVRRWFDVALAKCAQAVDSVISNIESNPIDREMRVAECRRRSPEGNMASMCVCVHKILSFSFLHRVCLTSNSTNCDRSML